MNNSLPPSDEIQQLFAEFGQQLLARRQQSGKDVQGIAKALLLAPAQIQALEKGQSGSFYSEAIRLQCLRRYADHLGLQLPEALHEAIMAAKRYEAHAETTPPSATSTSLRVDTPRRSMATIVLLTLLAAAIAAATWYYQQQQLPMSQDPADAVPTAAVEPPASVPPVMPENAAVPSAISSTAPSAEAATPSQASQAAASAAETTANASLLKVQSKNATWIVVNHGNQVLRQKLAAGETLEVPIEALKGLTIGDSSAVIEVDGKPLPLQSGNNRIGRYGTHAHRPSSAALPSPQMPVTGVSQSPSY